MPKFTPGPWAVGNKALDVFSRSADCSIADMASANSDEELLANARLIAAAPDMYRTLVKILDDTQNGQFADENKLIALLNSIDEENREFNYMYPIP